MSTAARTSSSLLAMAVLALLLCVCVPGCKSEKDQFAGILATAASPAAGRGAAATDLVAAIDAKTLTPSASIDLAQEQLLAVTKGTVKSADATAFAGAVLDAAARIQDRLPKGGEMEIFWINVGRLAFKSAEEAHAAGRVQEAMTLVFAGPERWQNQAYWERYSDHDALAAVLLAKSGQAGTAIARLRERVDLRDAALEVYQMLTNTRSPP